MTKGWIQRITDIFKRIAQQETQPENHLPTRFNDIGEIRHYLALPVQAELNPALTQRDSMDMQYSLSAVLDYMELRASRDDQEQPWHFSAAIIGRIVLSEQPTLHSGGCGTLYSAEIMKYRATLEEAGLRYHPEYPSQFGPLHGFTQSGLSTEQMFALYSDLERRFHNHLDGTGTDLTNTKYGNDEIHTPMSARNLYERDRERGARMDPG